MIVMIPRMRPMLVTSGPLPPDDEGWGYEVKWDGLRAMISLDAGHVGIISRKGHT